MSEPPAPAAEPAAQLAPAAPTGDAGGPATGDARPAAAGDVPAGAGSLLADALAMRREAAPAARSVVRPVIHRPAAHRPVIHRPAAHRPVIHRPVVHRPALAVRPVLAARTGPVVQRRGAPAVSAIRLAAMRRVVAFARSQVGKPYRSGGIGMRAFDCSGFTMRAYSLVGVRLPHSSGRQAARARTIPWSHALPGDLVVGPGHVGIYMGRGRMIDAGTSRTGVVYRKVYRGLRTARLYS
ncbi:C40 family peptidase [Spirilliplanes yamanashiensis]|uniref:C40 family peptidase n=1 Tax=Spirilliplanes yamanashiensis TaxID=42233 RepID=UPI001EF1CE82|nr:C40 family peptidase [Spirilliplanes yamanashiensis]MDP9816167.1 cell wall-associated NlpC family hydrolase [Spirilliplanes yamanashiensis]